MAIMTEPRQLSLGAPEATLALQVLKSFIGKLPLKSEDKQDLWGFFLAWIEAEDEDDRDYIEQAIREVLQQPKGKLSRLEFNDTSPKSDGYTRWVTWVSSEIKKCRTSAGLTQLQLAEKTGLPQSHISRIENAKHSPSQATLGKIAGALGLRLSDLDPSASDGSAEGS